MHTGEVVEEDGDLFGQAVHATARIAAKAKGGEILVSDVTRTIVGTSPGLTFSERGRFRLKGFDERWRLFELNWPISAEQAATAVAAVNLLGDAADRTPFVGRTSERAALSNALTRAIGGAGSLVLIGGAPGIGKTRLAEEVAADAAGREMAVLAGHSYEMAGASPYVAFVEIFEGALVGANGPEAFLADVLGDAAPEVARLVPRLRRIYPDLPTPLDLPPEQERQYLFTCLSDALGRLAGERPTLLLLDDLQWADEPTLLFLEHLAPQLSRLPLMVVATYRDVEVGRPLAHIFEDLHRRRLAQRLNLSGLAEADTAEVVRRLARQEPPPSLVGALHAATEGNPFFLEEVFRDLVERGRLFAADGSFGPDLDVTTLDVPEGVRMVIGRRLERLSDEAVRLLRIAAVAGRVFSYRLLQALGDLPADAVLDVIDEAERAILIRAGTDDEFLFAHELIRQTLVGGLSLPRRRRAHLRSAEANISLWSEHLDEHAAEIAHHLAEAGEEADPKQLLAFSLLAGQRALATSAFTEAYAHLERAVSLEAVALPVQRAELFFVFGLVLRRIGRMNDAIDAWQRSLEEYEALGDDEAIGRVCLEVGFNLVWASRWAEAAAMYQRGLDALGDRVTADRARLLARLAMTASYGGDLGAGDAMFNQSLQLADEIGDQGLKGFVLGELCCGLQASMRLAKLVDSGLRGAEAMRAAGDLWGATTALGFTEMNLVQLGRFSESSAVESDFAELAERLGNHMSVVMVDRSRGTRDFFRTGDLDALEAFARADLDFCEQRGWVWGGHSCSWIGLAEFLRGNWDAAAEWLERGSANPPPGALAGFCWSSWFQYLAFSGRRAEALSFVDEKRVELPTPGEPNTWTAWSLLFGFTEGLFVLGERDEPAGWHDLVVEARATGAVATSYIDGRLLERVAGIAATAAGKWDAAEAHFLLALRQGDELPHQVERLETRRFYAQMLTERAGPGDVARARTLLDEAVEGYTTLRMPRHRDLAQAAVAAIGG